MRASVAEKLIEALESGKYKEGKGVLRSVDDCFCPMGILCDMFDSSKWAISDVILVGGDVMRIMNYNHHVAIPPQEVLDWAGMKAEEDIKIRHWNDYTDLGFKGIAAKLRKGFENVRQTNKGRK